MFHEEGGSLRLSLPASAPTHQETWWPLGTLKLFTGKMDLSQYNSLFKTVSLGFTCWCPQWDLVPRAWVGALVLEDVVWRQLCPVAGLTQSQVYPQGWHVDGCGSRAHNWSLRYLGKVSWVSGPGQSHATINSPESGPEPQTLRAEQLS